MHAPGALQMLVYMPTMSCITCAYHAFRPVTQSEKLVAVGRLGRPLEFIFAAYLWTALH
jgi:hypothetical protein